MKKSFMIMVAAICFAVVTVQADVINTYDGESGSYWNLSSNGGVAVQWFTVSEGEIGTKFEFFCEKGSVSSSSYYCTVQIYDSSDTYRAGVNLASDQFGGTATWVAVEDLSLEAGTYYAQMYTNQAGFAGYLHAVLIDPSTYAGGYAAAGWNGGTPTGDDQDFWGRVTVESVPEPATMSLLLGGAVFTMIRKRNK